MEGDVRKVNIFSLVDSIKWVLRYFPRNKKDHFFREFNDGVTKRKFQKKIGSTIISILFELFDVGSDLLLAYTLFNGTYDAEKGYTAVPQPYFAMATLIFPIISFFGTSIYWWRHEKQKTISFLFLLLQLYPAFSQCRLLVLLYTKNPTWGAEKDRHEQKLSLIGM